MLCAVFYLILIDSFKNAEHIERAFNQISWEPPKGLGVWGGMLLVLLQNK